MHTGLEKKQLYLEETWGFKMVLKIWQEQKSDEKYVREKEQ